MTRTKIATCPASRHRIENIHNGKVASGTVKAGGQDKPAPGSYIRWDAEGVEKIEQGEQKKIQAVSDQFNRFQMMNFNEYVHIPSDQHSKRSYILLAVFIPGPNKDHVEGAANDLLGICTCYEAHI